MTFNQTASNQGSSSWCRLSPVANAPSSRLSPVANAQWSLSNLPDDLVLSVVTYLPTIDKVRCRSLNHHWSDLLTDLLNKHFEKLSWQIGVYYCLRPNWQIDVSDAFVVLGQVNHCPTPQQTESQLHLTIFRGCGGLHLQRALSSTPTITVKVSRLHSTVTLVDNATKISEGNLLQLDVDRIVGCLDTTPVNNLDPGVDWLETSTGTKHHTYRYNLVEKDDDSVILSSEEGYSLRSGSNSDSDDDDGASITYDQNFEGDYESDEQLFPELPTKRRRINMEGAYLYDTQSYVRFSDHDYEEEDYDW